MNDLRQSAEYAAYIEKIDWKVERVGNINIFIRPLGIFGAIAKIQRVKPPLPWLKIHPVLKKHHVWMTKLEPIYITPFNPPLKLRGGNPKGEGDIPPGFRQDNWPLLASKTLRVDLTPSPAKILASFKKDCRYCLRKVQGSRFKVQENNFDVFYELWKKAARIKRLWIPPEGQYEALIKSFGRKALCLTIDGLAGAVILMHNQVAYYYYAAALPEGKRRLLPYTVVWKLMQETKKHRCTVWDFEGTFDSRWPNKSILGYSHFKKSFGGQEISFPGSFTKWF